MMAKEISFFERIARKLYITDIHDGINYYLAKVKLQTLCGTVACIAATIACQWMWTSSQGTDSGWWLLCLSAATAWFGGGLAFFYIFLGVFKWPDETGYDIIHRVRDQLDFAKDFKCYYRTKPKLPPSAWRNLTKSFLVGGLVGGGFIWGLSLTVALFLYYNL